eukprot:COSAG01_NODE_759_length_13802_cov_16.155221_10_plen_41_part_00
MPVPTEYIEQARLLRQILCTTLPSLDSPWLASALAASEFC